MIAFRIQLFSIGRGHAGCKTVQCVPIVVNLLGTDGPGGTDDPDAADRPNDSGGREAADLPGGS